ncbi:OLC1v1016897C1 [Oldenlandia corymbosa var. corymbosa]|uniref:OLC1v1016897C1 n=1 Tax=Oldenlandia corymbosa var. corymbosa TaxID=529605 RepID=A0AAV1E890_OLDCO|nr:OLC1v1016897C1 [Oldenlandia corymbosa var. corymbosa]
MSFSSSFFSVLTPFPTKWEGICNSPLRLLQFTLLLMAMMISLSQANNYHPIILIPGAGGNQLEARLTSEYKPSGLFCDRWYPIKKDPDGWFRLWFDPTILITPFTKCFAERMMLYYDNELHDYKNAPGLQTRVPYFGSVKSLLYLNPRLKRLTSYMAPLVKALEEMGYRDGQNLFGAPYDFRYGLAEEGHTSRVGSTYLNDLKNLVENASALCDGMRVILLSHSLGGLYVHQLLTRNTQSWRKKYIKHFIALSTPWGGAVEQMLTFASGNTLGIPFANPLLVRDEQRSSESNLWLLPSPTVFPSGKLLVITKNASYSGANIAQFLKDLGVENRVYPYKSRILPMLRNFDLPSKVKVTCMIGCGVKTPETLIYGEAGFDEKPEIVYGDGDGTVNMISLRALEMERKGNKNSHEYVKLIKMAGVSHGGILKDRASLRKILNEISGINSGHESDSSALRTTQ